jgi:hypothetical protein
MERRHMAPTRADQTVTSGIPGLLQRDCAYGSAAGMDGECAGCRSTRLRGSPGQPSRPRAIPTIVHEALGSPGEMLSPRILKFMAVRFGGVSRVASPGSTAPASVSRAKLALNRPADFFEQGAERTATQVVGEPAKSGPDIAVASFAHGFRRARVQHDGRAAESARAIGARAYTVGPNIVFGNGAYAPETQAGRRLLAHELAHTLQQGPRIGLLMGAWDKAASECSDAAADKWIEKVIVDQETPQKVTAFWSDGRTESDACSSGKGHCCVDSANPSGVACSLAESHTDGSNCTPITLHMGFPVKNRLLNHKGVEFWTEFVPDRAIALHKYSFVDGTPLSDGCVRMNPVMAKTIFCNVRQNRTWVQVHGFARPSCDHNNLRNEWIEDFSMGGDDLSKTDGDTAAQIRETRRELNATFGRILTVGEIKALTADDIPRCSATTPLPKPSEP